MRTNYFVVTTPLQYLNALNIETSGERIIMFLSGFTNSEKFYSNIIEKGVWDKTYYFSDYNKMFRHLIRKVEKTDKLFIDSDYGRVTNSKLRRIKTKEIYVYEEGIGTYRSNLLSKGNGWLKKNILKFLGNKEFFAGSKYVKGIYVYDHQRHKQSVPSFSKERLHFKNDFSSQLENHIGIFIAPDLIEKYKNLFNAREVVLYLTSWNYNLRIEQYIQDLKQIQKSDVLIILKPHPHFKDFEKINLKYDDVVSGEVLVEILFILLRKYSAGFVVLHENSSSLQYYPEINNVTF
ncbi:polysialyltransferase family glycosyltransferase [uncultured Chryseobacterium sp.]|uniref:polysialyltransferase family glycosyltransferase n=1 Tax=uncultured Chryseobacterium sp. TaxID=259322 RepID=UPI0025FF25F8|nr:polysialyltransferase family glycosyltransferase [uncultured Chryseobacterium sp.]